MVAQAMQLDQVVAGMVLAEPVRQADGGILLPAGGVLTERQIDGLRQRGYKEVTVAAAAPAAAEAGGAAGPTADEERIRARVRRLFRRSEADAVTQDFFKAVLEYRLEAGR